MVFVNLPAQQAEKHNQRLLPPDASDKYIFQLLNRTESCISTERPLDKNLLKNYLINDQLLNDNLLNDHLLNNNLLNNHLLLS